MPARTRKPTAERRAEIARAALDLVGREGTRSLTTAALAKAVGLTTGALFRHFPSMDAVLVGVVRLAEERVEGTFPPADLPPRERLRRLARARVDLLRSEPGLRWLLRSDQAAPSLPPAAVARLEALGRRSRAFIGAAVRDAVREGTARCDVPAEVLVLAFTASVHALAGAPGVQGRVGRAPSPARAIEGLLRLLAAPAPGGS